MILGDVLRVLSTYCNAFGIDHKGLYILLFEEEDLNLEQTVKNTFGKRGFESMEFIKSWSKTRAFCIWPGLSIPVCFLCLAAIRISTVISMALVENDHPFF